VDNVPVPLRPDRLAEASLVVAAAFDDDPLTSFLFPDPSHRRGYVWANAATLRVILPLGATYTTPPPRIEGVAAFCPPGCYPRPWWAEAWQLRAGLLRVPLGTVLRAMRMSAAVRRLHPKEPHWYLETLAVRPDRQRQGVGSFLISSTLERADRDALPVYLETTKDVNVVYYRRFGFEVVEELKVGGGAPPVWTMLRAPQT
jgi:ribosomal protein S18 acetylase RimI-like enzyme